MRVLLTRIPERLQRPLQQSLATHHDVVSLPGDDRDVATCRQFQSCDVVIQGLPESGDPLVALDHASRGTWNLLTTTKAKRYILLSSMRMFSAYGPGWHIDESWAPRPSTEIDQLAPYLAEVASREISRSRPIECFILRFDDVVSPQEFDSGPFRHNWLHLEDAVSAIAKAVTAESAAQGGARWAPFHIVRGGTTSHFPEGRAMGEPFHWSANHRGEVTSSVSFPAPTWPPSPGPIRDLPLTRKIAILGAGGPLGAITTATLESDHILRLSDFRPLREIASLPPQSEGSPLPAPPVAPHSEVQADVTDPSAVKAVVEGMEVIINCTVMRDDPVQAFRVNTLGAYNVMRSAIDAGVPRVVHTGPILTLAPHPSGYNEDVLWTRRFLRVLGTGSISSANTWGRKSAGSSPNSTLLPAQPCCSAASSTQRLQNDKVTFQDRSPSRGTIRDVPWLPLRRPRSFPNHFSSCISWPTHLMIGSPTKTPAEY
jgi:nucleoside-diphosphate-sugar epimerase